MANEFPEVLAQLRVRYFRPERHAAGRGGRSVTTSRTWSGTRLRVTLEYSDSELRDVHEWELYTPDEFADMAETVGLNVLLSCAWFDPSIPPSADHLRMQFLLERPG